MKERMFDLTTPTGHTFRAAAETEAELTDVFRAHLWPHAEVLAWAVWRGVEYTGYEAGTVQEVKS